MSRDGVLFDPIYTSTLFGDRLRLNVEVGHVGLVFSYSYKRLLSGILLKQTVRDWPQASCSNVLELELMLCWLMLHTGR